MKHITIKNQLLRQKIENEIAIGNQKSANMVNAIVFVSLSENGAIDSVTISEHAELFEVWKENIPYAIGNIRRYGENIYRCTQPHTSVQNETPDLNDTLWLRINTTSIYPNWSRPIGSLDTYVLRDRVCHNGKKWESVEEDNSWEPGIYGWIEI